MICSSGSARNWVWRYELSSLLRTTNICLGLLPLPLGVAVPDLQFRLPRQALKLQNDYAADSAFNFCPRFPAQIPAQNIQFRHELGLGKALFLTHFADIGSDNTQEKCVQNCA